MTMHQKVNVLIFSIRVQKGQFWKNSSWTILFVFYCLRLLFPQKKSHPNFYSNIISWAFAFLYHSISFASPTAKPIGPCLWIMLALNYVFWGPRTSRTLWHFFFLGVNQSGPRMSSTANHIFYKALGRLRGGVTQPLSVCPHIIPLKTHHEP
jgi:hypothetical protein